MEASQSPDLDIRILKFPVSSLYFTFLVNGQGFHYCIIAVLEGRIEFVEYIEDYQGIDIEIFFTKRATLVRAITCNPVKLIVLEFNEQFARENLYEIHRETLIKLFNEDISKATPDLESFKVIKKLLLLLYKHNYSVASTNSSVICQLTFNLLLSCISDLKDIWIPKLALVANYKVVTAMKFLDMVEESATAEHGVRFYASKLAMTQGNLTRIIKEVTARAPKSIIGECLVRKAQVMLNNKLLTIYAVAEELGFKSSSAFINFFRFHTGRTPNDYRNRKNG